MPKRTLPKSVRPPKVDWHPLALQQLAVARFVRVVNRILDGEYSIMPDLLRTGENGTGGMEDAPRETERNMNPPKE